MNKHENLTMRFPYSFDLMLIPALFSLYFNYLHMDVCCVCSSAKSSIMSCEMNSWKMAQMAEIKENRLLSACSLPSFSFSAVVVVVGFFFFSFLGKC